MGVENIGKQISALRKERRIKQDELASYVGVSAQAVSKWENGGVPDTELLPKIADFFGISIDSLFGREIAEYSDLHTALCKAIIDTPFDNRIKEAFEFCWDIERSLYGAMPKDGGIKEYENELAENEQLYSSILYDSGFTRMGIDNKLQYFLIVPEPKNIDKAYFDGIDYVSFLKDFSDEKVFNACILLHKRDSTNAFTPNLLVKKMGVVLEEAMRILDVLKKYGLLSVTKIEMDDEIQAVYRFDPSPSFIAFLIFAREMIAPPNAFSYYSKCRNKPYLQ